MKKFIIPALFAFIAIALIASGGFLIGSIAGIASLALAPVGKTKMSDEELLDLASQNFSNFSGLAQNYTGLGDEFIDFGGSPTDDFSVLAERIFTISITAAASQTGVVYLTPGLGWTPGKVSSWTAAFTGTQAALSGDAENYTPAGSVAVTPVYPLGYVRDGSFKDTTDTYTFSATGSPYTLETFYSYIAANPMTLHMIRVNSGLSTALDQAITVEPQNAFKQEDNAVFYPSSYVDEGTYQDKKASVPMTGITVGPDVRISTTVVANTTTSYTFFLGNAINTRKALMKKQGKAAAVFAGRGVMPRTIGGLGRNVSRALNR